MIVTLSNGTQIEERYVDDNITQATVVPEERKLAEHEWNEYVALLATLSFADQRNRLANRRS